MRLLPWAALRSDSEQLLFLEKNDDYFVNFF
jgi:hypothetical protein